MDNQRQKRRYSVGVAVLLAIVILVAVGYIFFQPQELKAEETSAQKTRILMDTVVDLRVDAPSADELIDEVFAVMKELEQTLSRFVPTSEVSLINSAAGSWVQVGPDTMALVEIGLQMGELTQGAFDITIGAVLDLWGFGGEIRQIPAEDDLAAALSTVDYKQIEIDVPNSKIKIPAGTILDLGGIAKGYIVQKGIELLREANVSRAIINAGGDISVIGKRPDGQPWRVGVQDPLQPSVLRWIVPLDDQSIVTSGDYQRYFEQDGERWHHILDPQNGYPARGMQSVTVLGDDIVVCDTLATAIFVQGWEEGRQLALEQDGIEVILVSDQGEWISPGLEKRLGSQ